MSQWIQTYAGRKFFPLAPRAADIDLGDVAHALALQCRFNGHCRVFYSVAEHSVRVGRLLASEQGAPELAAWGLLHDAAEAYLGDLPSPIKRQLPEFQRAEAELLALVARRFELPWPMPAAVHDADLRLLATEARDLMGEPPEPWALGVAPLAERIVPWTAERAEETLLAELRTRLGA
jgi:hypothetical protein